MIWTYNLPDPRVADGVLRIVVDGQDKPTRLLSDMPQIISEFVAEYTDRPEDMPVNIVLYWNPENLRLMGVQSPSDHIH